ncbi:MAG: DUF262 domain-containing protein [Chitinophagaceae bacterium]|nr:DUF262 domain-containing protein [Chitinophagaceae bacterium]
MEQTQSLENLIKDIDAGKLVSPEFQRDFVWEISKTYDLFDSLVKDIFVGAIIYGIPSFEIAVREVDNRPKAAKGKRRPALVVKTITMQEILKRQKLDKANFRLALDGQQRITSIFRAIKGIDPVWFVAKNEFELETTPFDKVELEELLFDFDGSQDSKRISIKLSDVWLMDNDNLDDDDVKEKYFKATEYYKSFCDTVDFDEKAEFRKYRYLKKKLTELFKQEKLLSFYLLDMSLEKFVTFFERSNTRGVQLNFIDILAAKLYTGNFNLKKKIEDFQKKYPNYSLVPEIIVRAIAYIKSSPKEINRNYILAELKAEDFITWWDKLCDFYKVSLDFLYENKFIISQEWMPYENMLIPLMIFLKELNGSFHKMNQSQKEFLAFWYFNSAFSLRYSGSSNERIIEDSTIFTNIAKGKKISSLSFFNKLTKIQILSQADIYSFDRKGNAVYKGILNLINYHSGGLIDWNNDSKLSLNSELEDHHIFPKAYLDDLLSSEADKDFIDCVANRTLVPKKLNIKISDQKPSEYLNKIKEGNQNFDKTLENHLIPPDLLTGGFDNDFKFFLEYRCDKMFEIIKQHIISPLDKIKELFYEEIKLDESSNIPVFGKYKNNRADASFNPSSNKLFYKGKVYDSPSAAAQVVKVEFGANPDTTENGWTFWKFTNDNGEEKQIDEFRER